VRVATRRASEQAPARWVFTVSSERKTKSSRRSTGCSCHGHAPQYLAAHARSATVAEAPAAEEIQYADAHERRAADAPPLRVVAPPEARAPRAATCHLDGRAGQQLPERQAKPGPAACGCPGGERSVGPRADCDVRGITADSSRKRRQKRHDEHWRRARPGMTARADSTRTGRSRFPGHGPHRGDNAGLRSSQ